MERLIIKKFLITSASQQLLFQIRLPRDSKRIIGVCSTITGTKAFRSRDIGTLWLSTPSMGEVFYTEILSAKQSDYGISIMPSVNQPGYETGSLWVSGSKIEFNTLNRPVTETIVEGFYSDQRTVDGSYSLSIYLKIEL
ncbi:MAG: hypothetical protein ACO1N0_01725 [Fluviicola sp.]|jgi:hypothetical protein